MRRGWRLAACAAAAAALGGLLAGPPAAVAANAATTLDASASGGSSLSAVRAGPSPGTITEGVTIGRIPVGGLTPVEARALVERRFARELRLVIAPGREIRVAPASLGAAPYLGKAVALATRVRTPGFRVPLAVRVPRAGVERYLARLAARFDRPPVDAKFLFRADRPALVGGVTGRRLKTVISARLITRALKTHSREPLRLPVEQVSPKVTDAALVHLIVIRRESKKLVLYDGARLARTFQIATGMASFPTPLGRFQVVVKQRDPWWYPPPGASWTRGLKPVPPGPGNPLGTRWMGLSAPGIGIHGTPDAASVGYSASHGCIRMFIPQAEWLFDHIDTGTPVYIVAA